MQKANLRNKTLNSKQAKKCVYLLHNIICIMFKYACFVEDLFSDSCTHLRLRLMANDFWLETIHVAFLETWAFIIDGSLQLSSLALFFL